MSTLTPLPLPQKDHNMSHRILALPLPGVAISSEGLEAHVSVLTAHVKSDPGTQRQIHGFREEGKLIVAYFLQRKASGRMAN